MDHYLVQSGTLEFRY